MSTKSSNLINFFKKAPASSETCWRLYLYLFTEDISKKRTRKALMDILEVTSRASVTQILNHFEKHQIIGFLRDFQLPGKAKDYVVLDSDMLWVQLGDIAGLTNREIEKLISLVHHYFGELELSVQDYQDLTKLFDNDTKRGKILSLFSEIYPPFFFLLPYVLLISNNEDFWKTIDIKSIPFIITKTLEGLYRGFAEEVINWVFKYVELPKLGKLESLSSETDTNTKSIQVKDAHEDNLSFSVTDYIIALSMLNVDGYYLHKNRILLSIPIAGNNIDNAANINNVKLSIELENGEVVQIPTQESQLMEFDFLRPNSDNSINKVSEN